MSKLLTIQQAAEKLGVASKTLRRWEESGILVPQRTIGNQRRYTQNEILEFKKNKKSRKANNNLSQVPPISPISPTPPFSPKDIPPVVDKELLPNRVSYPQPVVPSNLISPLPPLSLPHDAVSQKTVNEPISQRDWALSQIKKTEEQATEESPYSTFSTSSTFSTFSKKISQLQDTYHMRVPHVNLDIYRNLDILATIPATKIKSSVLFIGLFFIIATLMLAVLDRFYLLPASLKGLVPGIAFLQNQARDEERIFATIEQKEQGSVLGFGTEDKDLLFGVNVGSMFREIATFSAGLRAPNVIYDIIPGSGIEITEGQTPTISSSDTLQLVTDRGATTTNLVTFAGGVTLSTAVLNLGNLTSDPSSAVNGATYYNTTSNIFRCYKNGSWVDCDTGSTSSGDITGVSAGSGLTGGGTSGDITLTIGAGNGITLSDDAITLDVTTTGTSATTTANSGLEVAADGLSLLRGCADTEVLKWDATAVAWECGTGGGSLTVKEGGTIESAAITSLDFLDGDFNIDIAATEADITLAATLTTVTGVAGDFNIAGGDLTTSNTTSTLFNTTATTLSIGGAATTFNIGPTGSGASSILISGGSADTGCTLNGATGDLTCSGNIVGAGSGTSGFWARSGTTLETATANDIVLLDTTNTTGADFAITNTGIYTGTGLASITANSATTGNVLSMSATGLTTGELVNIDATYLTSDGSDNELIDINITNNPSSSANTLRGIDLNLADADDNANTLYGVKITTDNSSNTSAGTHSIYGGHFTATGKTTGTTTAYGIFATASGADTNYAAAFGDGTDLATFTAIGDLTFIDADAGATISGPAGGSLILTGTNSQNLNLTSIGTGDITFTLDSNTNAQFNATAPAVDAVVISGGTVATDGVDALAITLAAADGTNLTNSGINIALTSNGTASGDLMRGLYIDLAAVADANSTNKAIEIENTAAWDTDIELQNDETIINSTDGTVAISGTTFTLSEATTLTASSLATLTTAAALSATTTTTLTLGTSATINANATALNLQADGTPDVNIAGGSGATGCTVTNSSGALACSGTITSNGTALNSYWSKSGTTLSPTTANDVVSVTSNDNTNATLGIINNTITTLGVGANTAGMVDFSSTSLTTGNLLNLETTTALTSGRMLNITSTSTALTSGNLLRLDWTPGSSTTATGDLFSLNIGSNGTTTGNLFNILDSSSSIFSVSETAFTTSQPVNFTSPGDVAIAYDLNFTNPTASFITSLAPLTLRAGEVFNSSNLSLQTYNAGSMVIESASAAHTGTNGLVDINFNSTTDTAKALNIDAITDSGATGGIDNTALNINLTQNDADADQFGMVLTANATTNAAAGSYEALIKLVNAENTIGAVTDGILIDSTSATDTDITDAIDVSDSNITNAINVGQNFILGDGIRLFSSSSTVYTVEDTAGNDLCTITDAGTTGNLVCSGTVTGSSGAFASTLQNAYDNDADGSDTLITLNADDDNLIIKPIAGTNFQIAQVTSAPTTDIMSITNAGLGTITDTVDGLSIAFVTADGTNATNNALNLSLTSGGTASGDVARGLFIDLASVADANSTNKAIEIENTAAWDTDIELQNDETIINSTDGTVAISGTTFTLSEATTLSAASLTTFTCTDCIDFDDLANSMTVDEATDINLGTLALTIDLDSTGDFSIRDVTTDIATFADTGAITFAPTSTSDLAITLDEDTTTTFTQTTTTANASSAVTISLSPGGTGNGGVLEGLYVVQNDTGTTEVYDALIHVENLKTPETLTDGILIEQDATSGTTTNGLRALANGGTLTNGIQVQRASGTLTNGMLFTGNMNDTIEINSQPVAATSGNIINIASTLAVMTGSNTVRGIFLDLTNADHITGSNVLTAIDIDSITGDAETTETAFNIGTGWDSDINATTSLEIGIGGTNEVSLTATNLAPIAAEGNSLGSSSLEWEQLFLGDNNGINFGLDDDWTLAYDEATDDRLEFTAAGATGFAVTTTTGVQTYTSSVVTGTTTTSGFVFDATAITTGTGMYLTSDSITQGKLAQIATTGNTLTTGTLLDLRTTATSLTGTAGIGSLANFDWSPGSTTTATGDLFALNIGTNGTTTGNLFNILDAGSSLFSVSETAFTTSLPSNFTAAGDLSVAYDIALTNQTASYIKSNGPLYIEAGETFESNDITLTAYNTGSIILDPSATGTIDLQGATNFGTQVTLANDATPDVSGGSWFTTGGTTTITDFDAGSNALKDGHFIIIEGAHAVTIDCNASAEMDCGAADIALGDDDIISLVYDATEDLWRVVSWVDETDTQTGADVAEYFVASEAMEPGDVVAIDSTTPVRIKKSDSSYQNKSIGIVSTQPGITLGVQEPGAQAVALVGRVPTKVSTENGPIAIGDYLTTSSTPGVAMKATRPGQVIGKALEAYDGSGSNQITVFVNVSFADPKSVLVDLYLNDQGQLVSPVIAKESLPLEEIRAYLGLEAASEEPETPEEEAAPYDLSTDPLHIALEQQLMNHESRIMNQEEAIASLSAALSALSEVEGSTSSTSGMLSPDMLMGIDLDVHNATMSGTLAVLGKTLLSDLTVTGEIVTGLLRIDGLSSEIHTLVGPLKLQENGLNGIELFAGLMTIDPTGDITTEGILAAKEVKAEKLTIVETAQASGSAVLASSVGTVTIPAGETSIDVQTTALTADSLIFVTPQRAVAAGAKRLNSNTFTITLEQAPVSNLKVQWWIIN